MRGWRAIDDPEDQPRVRWDLTVEIGGWHYRFAAGTVRGAFGDAARRIRPQNSWLGRWCYQGIHEEEPPLEPAVPAQAPSKAKRPPLIRRDLPAVWVPLRIRPELRDKIHSDFQQFRGRYLVCPVCRARLGIAYSTFRVLLRILRHHRAHPATFRDVFSRRWYGKV